MADAGSALTFAFLGAALMVVGSIMNYNIADEDCDDEYESSMNYGNDDYEDCVEELADSTRLATLLYNAGYPVLLFSLALGIINRG